LNIALGLIFVPCWSTLTGRVLAGRKRPNPVERGTVIIDARAWESSKSRPGEVTLAGRPIAFADEAKHFKMLGTTGTGKSTVIRELLTGAIARADRAIITDPDGSYARHFYDAARGDVILNPFDARAVRWDLFAEIIKLHDADQLARSLIPDYDGQDRNWRGYARTFLTAILRQLHRIGKHRVETLYTVLVTATEEDLRELLEGTPAAPFLGKDNGKFLDSMRSITIQHLALLEHLISQTEGEPMFSRPRTPSWPRRSSRSQTSAAC
jgi:Type IV secretion-system coupling protein DNA-binding domain